MRYKHADAERDKESQPSPPMIFENELSQQSCSRDDQQHVAQGEAAEGLQACQGFKARWNGKHKRGGERDQDKRDHRA